MLTMNFLAWAETSAAASAFGRQIKAREDVDLVADDRLLRQALGDVRRDAAIVLADQLDLLAGDLVAVLLHVELDAVVDLRARIGELAGERHDDADPDGVLERGQTLTRPAAAARRTGKCRFLRVGVLESPPDSRFVAFILLHFGPPRQRSAMVAVMSKSRTSIPKIGIGLGVIPNRSRN